MSPIFTNNEHIFHYVELIFNKNVWKQLILDFSHKIFFFAHQGKGKTMNGIELWVYSNQQNKIGIRCLSE